jgi:hypothetical protein
MDKLNQFNLSSIKSAGPRYTPQIEEGAPNLSIKYLLNALEILALTDKYKESLSGLVNELETVYSKNLKLIEYPFRKIDFIQETIQSVRNLCVESPGKSNTTIKKARINIQKSFDKLSNYRAKLFDSLDGLPRDSKDRIEIDNKTDAVLNILNSLNPIVQFADSPSSKLIENNCLFITGEWGSGKTHFLCDITKNRLASGLPTLFILGHQLNPTSSIEESITQIIKESGTIEQFFKTLNEAGIKKNTRTLIIIDGINEGDRKYWKKNLNRFVSRLKDYPNLALVISCRNPYQEQILSPGVSKRFVHLTHTGFSEIEFEAQEEFFKYYNIPIPQYPLLTSEFQRPLFLKIVCETLTGKTQTSKSRGLSQIFAGQKGMTKLLEDFICKVGKPIEQEFKLRDKACWEILKGCKLNGEFVGVAPSMASHIRDYINFEELLEIVSIITNISHGKTLNKLCIRIINEGLLVEDTVYEEGLKEVIRLPYQRFSDHVICRHLFEKYLKIESEDSIRHCFYKNKPLGKIFELYGRDSFKHQGLVSAFMLEFPERIKRKCFKHQELVYYLPKEKCLLSTITDVFIEGLTWRSSEGFSPETDHILQLIIEKSYPNEALDTLVCLATRPNHHYSSIWLAAYLKPLSITSCDLLWSEFLRYTSEESTVNKVLSWIESSFYKVTNSVMAENILRLCMLFLTTTNRPLRDRATKCLVLLGTKFPKELFNITIESQDFNDPYIKERSLAACYGMLMRTWAFPSVALKTNINKFARRIYDSSLLSNRLNPTHHILIQDYIQGILQIARKITPHCLGKRKLSLIANPPKIKGIFPNDKLISKEVCSLADKAIHMDFENYTIGGLVKNRRNYDSKNPEYGAILKKIKWRIIDIGYTPTLFENLDQGIGNSEFSRNRSDKNKTERYGKKYSWIAYYEMCGLLKLNKKLPDLEDNPRIYDADIDPSFPPLPLNWKPKLKETFIKKYSNAIKWLSEGATPNYKSITYLEEIDNIPGPWLLLDGYISERSNSDAIGVFSFLRGVLINKTQKERLKSSFLTIQYPGNSAIPEPGQDHLTYAGEIPWSDKFAWGYRSRKGTILPFHREAFSSNSHTTRRVKFEKASKIDQMPYLGWDYILVDSKGRKRKKGKHKETPEFIDVTRYKKIPGIPFELPVHSYSWSTSNSEENKVGHVEFLAPAICKYLNLRNKDNSLDLFTSEGVPATLFRIFDGKSSLFSSHLLYIKKDLLERYLKSTDQKLVWMIWGEREIVDRSISDYPLPFHDIWTKYKHIHRTFIDSD